MEFIDFKIIDGVAEIALNRPDKLNSFVLAMGKEFQTTLDQCRDDKSVRAVYLTGNGRAFCAGQDLEEAIAEDEEPIQFFVENIYNPIVSKIRAIEKPVICGVNGVAAGAGANIAFACDLTFAIKSANFIQSFSNIGLIPDSGGTYTLPRLVGMQKATAMMFLANKTSAEEAEKMGLIYKCVGDDDLGEALEMAKKLAKRPTKGLGLTKRALNLSLQNSWQDQLIEERDLQSEAGNSHDYKEGVQAFLEKRKPNYIGE